LSAAPDSVAAVVVQALPATSVAVADGVQDIVPPPPPAVVGVPLESAPSVTVIAAPLWTIVAVKTAEAVT
jgi:hypothetical protein